MEMQNTLNEREWSVMGCARCSRQFFEVMVRIVLNKNASKEKFANENQ